MMYPFSGIYGLQHHDNSTGIFHLYLCAKIRNSPVPYKPNGTPSRSSASSPAVSIYWQVEPHAPTLPYRNVESQSGVGYKTTGVHACSTSGVLPLFQEIDPTRKIALPTLNNQVFLTDPTGGPHLSLYTRFIDDAPGSYSPTSAEHYLVSGWQTFTDSVTGELVIDFLVQPPVTRPMPQLPNAIQDASFPEPVDDMDWYIAQDRSFSQDTPISITSPNVFHHYNDLMGYDPTAKSLAVIQYIRLGQYQTEQPCQ